MKNKIISIADTLGAIQTEDIIKSAVDLRAKCGTSKRNSVKIDLSSVKFIDPYGLVSLCLLGKYLKCSYKKVNLVLSDDNTLQTYLNVMNFPILAGEYMSFGGAKFIESNVIHQSKSHVLLEITKVHSKAKNVDECIKACISKISDILATEMKLKKQENSDICSIISELCNNIRDHSENEGFIAVQKYHKSNGINFVVIGVGDLGIGIKNSLGKRYNISHWSHFDAILKSLKKGFSSLGDRGMGLHIVKNLIDKYSGQFHIRSGDTRIYLSGEYKTSFLGSYFPGTQISIRLNDKKS